MQEVWRGEQLPAQLAPESDARTRVAAALQRRGRDERHLWSQTVRPRVPRVRSGGSWGRTEEPRCTFASFRPHSASAHLELLRDVALLVTAHVFRTLSSEKLLPARANAGLLSGGSLSRGCRFSLLGAAGRTVARWPHPLARNHRLRVQLDGALVAPGAVGRREVDAILGRGGGRRHLAHAPRLGRWRAGAGAHRSPASAAPARARWASLPQTKCPWSRGGRRGRCGAGEADLQGADSGLRTTTKNEPRAATSAMAKGAARIRRPRPSNDRAPRELGRRTPHCLSATQPL